MFSVASCCKSHIFRANRCRFVAKSIKKRGVVYPSLAVNTATYQHHILGTFRLLVRHGYGISDIPP